MDRVPAFRRMLLAKPSLARGIFWTGIAVAIPAAIRWLIHLGESAGTPYVTFYPAILLTALLLGWRYGAVAAVLTGIVVNRLLRLEPLDFRAPRDLLVILLFALTCAILIAVAAMVRRLVADQAAAAEREAALNLELLHRVKNMLATVNSLATMTARHSDPAEFIDAFSGRIAALSRASDLLTLGREVQCDIRRLIETATVPFRTEDTFKLHGPDGELPRETCVPLGLALYELCTNAAKYGALSVPGGVVLLDWEMDGDGGMLIRWREQGGPPVPQQRSPGLGSRLLRAQAGLPAVRLEFPVDGVRCEFEIDRP